MRVQAHHRYARPERLEREHQLGAQPIAEMRHVKSNVTAGEIDEIKPIEDEDSLRGHPCEKKENAPRRGRAHAERGTWRGHSCSASSRTCVAHAPTSARRVKPNVGCSSATCTTAPRRESPP